MSRIELLESLELAQVETLAFAGGGNRCWWQAGAVSHLLQEGWRLPQQLIGTSAGAAIAVSCCIAEGPRTALAACLSLYGANERIFDWRGLARLKLRFAHQHIYPAWLASFVNAASFTSLRSSGTRLRIAVTRPVRVLGLAGSIFVGTLAYLVDKHLWGSIHPRLPKLVGLRQEFVDLHDCHSPDEMQALLGAAAAAPPFMASRLIGGALAIDGGYTDNAPIPQQTREERAKTLVLLTRHYPKLPPLFRWRGRMYWQPSRKIPVSTWDCLPRTTVREAFALGERDAQNILLRF